MSLSKCVLWCVIQSIVVDVDAQPGQSNYGGWGSGCPDSYTELTDCISRTTTYQTQEDTANNAYEATSKLIVSEGLKTTDVEGLTAHTDWCTKIGQGIATHVEGKDDCEDWVGRCTQDGPTDDETAADAAKIASDNVYVALKKCYTDWGRPGCVSLTEDADGQGKCDDAVKDHLHDPPEYQEQCNNLTRSFTNSDGEAENVKACQYVAPKGKIGEEFTKCSAITDSFADQFEDFNQFIEGKYTATRNELEEALGRVTTDKKGILTYTCKLDAAVVGDDCATGAGNTSVNDDWKSEVKCAVLKSECESLNVKANCEGHTKEVDYSEDQTYTTPPFCIYQGDGGNLQTYQTAIKDSVKLRCKCHRDQHVCEQYFRQAECNSRASRKGANNLDASTDQLEDHKSDSAGEADKASEFFAYLMSQVENWTHIKHCSKKQWGVWDSRHQISGVNVGPGEQHQITEACGKKCKEVGGCNAFSVIDSRTADRKFDAESTHRCYLYHCPTPATFHESDSSNVGAQRSYSNCDVDAADGTVLDGTQYTEDNCPGTCADGVQNKNETDVDCGSGFDGCDDCDD